MKQTISIGAKEILDSYKKFGVEYDLLFSTTFKRYQKQLDFLNKLENEIDNNGVTVVKEYVKGRGKHELPHIIPHSLRHTFATLQITSGVDIRTVQSRTGHSL